jgi:hypothetical protein
MASEDLGNLGRAITNNIFAIPELLAGDLQLCPDWPMAPKMLGA